MNWTAFQVSEYQRKQNKPPVPPSSDEPVDNEASLHNEIMDYCDCQWPRWKYIRARMDQRSTIQEGAQDITIFMPGGKVLCVECKAKNRKQSPVQLAWAAEMAKLGFTVHVVRCWDEFKKLVEI